jgi:hypothetical protein
MNCANHPEVAATAYCRNCGKALCPACQRDVRGAIYCEDCLAARVAGAPAVAGASAVAVGPTGEGNPVAAALLGMIPGVGAMYNGQMLKAFIHVVIFATAIWAADHVNDAFGVIIAFWWFYMVFDAYKTAKARQLGLPLPDPFGFERMWPGSVSAAGGAVAAPGVQPAQGVPAATAPGAVPAAAPPQEIPRSNVPTGAIVLIVIGVLFLLDTMGIGSWHWFGRFWPLVLIIMGVLVWIRRRPPVEQ